MIIEGSLVFTTFICFIGYFMFYFASKFVNSSVLKLTCTRVPDGMVVAENWSKDAGTQKYLPLSFMLYLARYRKGRGPRSFALDALYNYTGWNAPR